MGIKKRLFVLLFSLWFASYGWAAVAKLNDVQLTSDTLSKSIVITTTHNINYKWFLLANPNRLIVDLADTHLQANLPKLNFGNTPIKSVRAGLQKNQVLRLVFDLNYSIKPQVASQLLQDGSKRISIVLEGKANFAQTAQPIPEVISRSTKVIQTSSLTKPVMSMPTQERRKVVVVIDPGHGGKDPGATGARGTREKDVVLAISKNLAALLNNTPGYSAILTRDGDYFIELRGRLKLARKDKADMFVAIHADAYINQDARGSSVFALSAHGASSEAARWLAERENYSELGGVNLNQLNDKDNMLRSVLIDLSQNATIGSSLQLGSALLNSLGKFNSLHHGKVEQAPFMVLKSPDIPSVLVETGFLSNPWEEQNLRNPSYQQKIASALHEGIKDYFSQNPPEGTLIASTARPQRYIVARGDSVASIAQQFRTSVDNLKRMNNMSSSAISLGQVLLIPASTHAY
ncbi:MAG: amiC [Gammaproteobacteria bacterium]|nr:amiC [Gammaproteobacteria bacterium]